jgi:hypothetical protein
VLEILLELKTILSNADFVSNGQSTRAGANASVRAFTLLVPLADRLAGGFQSAQR